MTSRNFEVSTVRNTERDCWLGLFYKKINAALHCSLAHQQAPNRHAHADAHHNVWRGGCAGPLPKAVYFYTSPPLAGPQERGSSEAQENPCYVNLLSTETTNSPPISTELGRVKGLARLSVLLKEAKGAQSDAFILLVLSEPAVQNQEMFNLESRDKEKQQLLTTEKVDKVENDLK